MRGRRASRSDVVPGGRSEAALERSADRIADHLLQREDTGEAAPLFDDSGAASDGRTETGGLPLPGDLRSFFEPQLGHSLAKVRIHDDASAHDRARSINARAFSRGNSIWFGDGEYTPHSREGRRLIAHELAHVAQMREGMAGAETIYRQVSQEQANTIHGKLIELMCQRFATRDIVSAIASGNLRIVLFETAFDQWEEADGSHTENELPGLRGNTCVSVNIFCPEARTIRLRDSLSIEDMMMTLYHEVQHWNHSQDPTGPRGLESEIQARIATEQFAIDSGRPPTRASYRTAAGTVDEAAIRAEMAASPHYSPVGRTRIGRRYVGETEITNTWSCPPIGDFPTPDPSVRYA